MTIILSSAVVVFGALLFLLLGSQVELYRNIQQLREHSGLLDRPLPITLSSARLRPSAVGLPAHLDTALAAVVLFLSDKCSTCRSIAAALDGAVPRDVVLVLDAGGAGSSDLMLSYDLDEERAILDHERGIASRLNIKSTPAALVIQHGHIARASTVPSTRQLYALLESVRAPDFHEGADGTDLLALTAGKEHQ